MKYILAVVIVLFGFHAIGQNSFFLQAKAGGGLSGTTGKIVYDNFADVAWAKPLAKIGSVNATLLLGYQFNNLSFTLGIEYLQTGYKEHYAYYEFWETEVENTEHFYHLLLPFTLSRKFHFTDRLLFNPGLGAAFCYNYAIRESGRQNDSNNVFHSYNNTLSKKMFDYNFLRNSLCAIVQATFGYSINKRIDITIGPEIQYMLTSIEKPTGAYNADHQNVRNYAMILNAGVIWHFKRADTPQPGK